MKYKPFKDDPMMRELHEQRAEYAAKVKGMTPKQELEFARRDLQEKLARDGWALVPVRPGVMKLKRIRKSRPTKAVIAKKAARLKK